MLASGNPDLDCIQVDDVAYSTANWTNIDAGTTFSTDCSTFVADCPEDITGDGQVDIQDFIQFNSAFGSLCGDCPEDVSGNGVVDIQDFIQFNSAFGSMCE